jgi:hypothetical protein
MYAVMQSAAASVNFTDIVKNFSNNDSSSPSALRKILGHEKHFQPGSIERNPSTNGAISPQTNLLSKASMQRKSELWLSKHILAAIDLHVKEVSALNIKTLTELVFKLNEICENEVHMVR